MFTVVIPTMWKSDILLDFLKKLVLEDLVFEIILINNDHKNTPRDDILFHNKIRLVDFGKNIFVNPAWNYGVRESKTELVCIANDDVDFDLRLFSEIKNRFTDDVGSFGLHPGALELGQLPYFDGAINFTEWQAGHDLLGYGCLMFVKRSQWRDIPDELKVFCGDAFIFDRSLWLGKKNILIHNIDLKIKYATTTNSDMGTGENFSSHYLIKEGPIYEQIRSYESRANYFSPGFDTTVNYIPRKLVIDTFMFFNEIEMLEKRLEYLYDYVDYFVISESNLTHSGKSKKLNYLDVQEKYKKYKRKIIYAPFLVSRDDYDFPENVENFDIQNENWRLEKDQRNYITEIIKKFKQDCFVIISDVDEIPYRHALEFGISNMNDLGAIYFEQKMFYYNLENYVDVKWYGTILATKDVILKNDVKYVREHSWPAIFNAGCHLSYFGNVDQIINKIESFAHQEFNKDKYKDPEAIKESIENHKDLYQRDWDAMKKVNPLDIVPQDFYDVFSKIKN